MTITVDKDKRPVSFQGEDAVDFFRIRTLKSAIKLLKAGIQPTRGFTMTKALTEATKYTGQRYKRTESDKAYEDLGKIETSRLKHIPIVERS